MTITINPNLIVIALIRNTNCCHRFVRTWRIKHLHLRKFARRSQKPNYILYKCKLKGQTVENECL
jgi:hypothetical protein